MQPDHFRKAAADAAARMKLSATELADACGNHPNADHIDRYLTGRAHMNSASLSRLYQVLGLPFPRAPQETKSQ